MAQPAVIHSDIKTDYLGVPVFWEKTSAEPPFLWKSCTGQFFHSKALNENCKKILLLTDAAPVFDDPTPRPELILSSETTDEPKRRTARDIAAGPKIAKKVTSKGERKHQKWAQTRSLP